MVGGENTLPGGVSHLPYGAVYNNAESIMDIDFVDFVSARSVTFERAP